MTTTKHKSMRHGLRLLALGSAIGLAFLLQTLSPEDRGAVIVQSLLKGQMPVLTPAVPCDLICKGPQILPATGGLGADQPRLRDI